MGHDVEVFDASSVTDQQIRLYHEFLNRLLGERLPDDPPKPLEAAVRALREVTPNVDRTGFAAVRAGVWVGVALVFVPNGEDDSLRVELGVIPECRRQGVGSELLDRARLIGARTGKRLLTGDTYDRVPAGAAFAERAGAIPGLRSTVNRLALCEVDRAMIRKWIDEGPIRAPAYELVAYDGRTPDHLVEQVASILNVIHDAPTDDLDTKPATITAEMFGGYDAWLSARFEMWWLLAREKATGLIVGETDMRWNPEEPQGLLQGLTVVRREHRGRALGKWLKAAMIDRVLKERPRVVHVTTSNADSNDAMLGINTQLGFKPYTGTTTWQVSVSALRQTPAVRPLPTQIALAGNLRLELLDANDAEELQQAIEESRHHLEPFMPFVSSDPPDVEFRRQWIIECRVAFEAGSAFTYGIVDSGAIIGGCGINPKVDRVASIGYWVHADHTGRGIATSVARGLASAAFDAGFSTVLIRHDEANIASGAIAARLGFSLLRREPHSIDAPGQTGTTLVWQLGDDDARD